MRACRDGDGDLFALLFFGIFEKRCPFGRDRSVTYSPRAHLRNEQRVTRALRGMCVQDPIKVPFLPLLVTLMITMMGIKRDLDSSVEDFDPQ